MSLARLSNTSSPESSEPLSSPGSLPLCIPSAIPTNSRGLLPHSPVTSPSATTSPLLSAHLRHSFATSPLPPWPRDARTPSPNPARRPSPFFQCFEPKDVFCALCSSRTPERAPLPVVLRFPPAPSPHPSTLCPQPQFRSRSIHFGAQSSFRPCCPPAHHTPISFSPTSLSTLQENPEFYLLCTPSPCPCLKSPNSTTLRASAPSELGSQPMPSRCPRPRPPLAAGPQPTRSSIPLPRSSPHSPSPSKPSSQPAPRLGSQAVSRSRRTPPSPPTHSIPSPIKGRPTPVSSSTSPQTVPNTTRPPAPAPRS